MEQPFTPEVLHLLIFLKDRVSYLDPDMGQMWQSLVCAWRRQDRVSLPQVMVFLFLKHSLCKTSPSQSQSSNEHLSCAHCYRPVQISKI